MVHGCADGGGVGRRWGTEVALYAKGTEPLYAVVALRKTYSTNKMAVS